MDYEELEDYGDGKKIYGWHIDNLQIFKFPKELNDFHKVGYSEELEDIKAAQAFYEGRECYLKHEDDFERMFKDLHQEYCIKKPPQSWQYIEVV